VTIKYKIANPSHVLSLIWSSLVLVVLLQSAFFSAFAQDFTNSEVIGLTPNAQVYTDNNTITITGTVSSIDEPTVLIGIHDPYGFPTGFYFGDINSKNEFSISFLAKAGVNFKIEGKYDATAYYGDSKKLVYFNFVESLENETDEPAPSATIEDQIRFDT